MVRGARASEVRPLSHRFQMIHGFGRFDFHDAFEPTPLRLRRQHEVREHLARPYPDAGALLFAHVRGDLVLTLQLRLQEPDDTVVLELLADRPNQNWTQRSLRGTLNRNTRSGSAA
jgi:hypothetical protein